MITAPAYQGKTVGVFGLARTGMAAVHSLVASGADVWAWDDNEERREVVKAVIKDLYEADITEMDALLLAPGVPLTHPEPHPLVTKANAAGVKLISDIDVWQAARKTLPKHKVVAITGTNGKSTTTALIGHLVKTFGKPVAVGGNIGTGVLSLQSLEKGGVYVFELSSFQLDLTKKFHADVAILLNVTPDHLDRHGTFENYLAAKTRLFEMQKTKKGVAVISVDDDAGRELIKCVETGAIAVSVNSELDTGVYVEAGVLVDALGEQAIEVGSLLKAPSLQGSHNWQNAACAYAAARHLGFDPADIYKGLCSFPGLVHRQEVIATIGGVRFVNDSKATNSDAAVRALNSFENIHWIAGGRAKETSFQHMAGCASSVKRAYLNGEAADTLARDLGEHMLHACYPDLATAFQAACDNTVEGDTVLLSPACTAFDQFPDFEKRGDYFRTLVEAYAKEKEASR